MTEASNKRYELLVQNIMAGLTVSFVAVSLGAAFGLLSGRGAFSGMISAALIASITALFGGTRVQCSGPTGPMTAITAVIVAAAYDTIPQEVPGINPDHFINITIIMMAGILGLLGILRLGRFIELVPVVVVSGFMNGIALIIWLDQVKKLFGIGGKTAFSGSTVQNTLLVLMAAALCFFIPKLTSRYLPKYASYLSATIISIIFTTLVAHLAGFNVELVQLSSSLKSFSDVGDLIAAQFPATWSLQIVMLALPFAIQLALLCYLDTLLTSLVVDKMTNEKTKPNQELAAQGLAGLVVAFIGGIPGAQATIRSVLIVKEKATMRLAGVLVGVFALIEMVVFQDVINQIPQSVFAGVLIKVGYDVFDWLPVRLYMKEVFRKPSIALHSFFSRHDDEAIFVTNREALVIAGTTIVTVVWDLNVAVIVFTLLFYFHNRVLNRTNPMRDLKPYEESEPFGGEG
jgi:SulP family sulfate permease